MPELRSGISRTDLQLASPDVLGALTIPALLDTLAIRVNGPQAWSEQLVLDKPDPDFAVVLP